MEMPSFSGVYPILPTPFSEDENLDLESLDRLVRFMARLGVDGITVLGVLGEANRLLDSEREAVIRTTVAAAGRLPVIVGTSHPGTTAAAALSRRAEEQGAAAVMVAPCPEPVPSEDRIREYYQRIAAAISIPIVVQDHPASTQVHMSLPLLVGLVNDIQRVACIKEEAPPTPARIAALVAAMDGRRVPVLTGLGGLYGLFDLERGASGFNTGFAFPEVLMAIVAAARGGEWARAQAVYDRFLPLIVFEQQPGVAIRKEIFRMRGLLSSGRVRHPAPPLHPATAAQIAALLGRMLPGADLTGPLDLAALP